MDESPRVRAARGDVAAIADLLWALGRSAALLKVDALSDWVTPEMVQSWLNTANNNRPPYSSHRERLRFNSGLEEVTNCLVTLAIVTDESWYELLSHPVFEPQPPPPGSVTGLPEEAVEVAAFAVAVGLTPFLQTIATQAAQRTFMAARTAIWRRLGKGGARISGPHLVIEERDGRLHFRLPRDVPDAALEALVALGDQGLERLAEPDPKGRRVTVTWNVESGKWERIVHRE
ncbi:MULTISPECIES: hypothetical protein [unclassified Streptomyces]|uniref:hypothetical protein n=1 Tax=Streptomyces sp. NBC_00723 TaxID=2903673 RepID=UPI00386917F1